MKPTFIIIAFTLVIAVTGGGVGSQLSEAALIVSAGFNDASGINSDADPNSPYELNALAAGQGGSEPGWAGPWLGGGGTAIVQDAITFEGDGALRVFPTTGTGRNWSDGQTGNFVVEQRLRFTANSRTVIYIEDADFNSVISGQGPVIHAFPNGTISVNDSGTNEIISMGWVPDVWYTFTTVIDFPSQTYEFFLDGVKHNAPDPLGFRGGPGKIDRIRYLSEVSGTGTYVDQFEVFIPEPEPEPGPPFGPPFDGEPPFGPPFDGEPPFGPPSGDPPFGPPPGVPPGDGNLSGNVDVADYTIWADGFGAASPQFTDGDYNGNGSVDVADYTTWANNFGQSASAPQIAAAAVPEPSTLALTCCALLGLTVYGWRRRRRA